jgi:lysophospholipase L1-like esterase
VTGRWTVAGRGCALALLCWAVVAAGCGAPSDSTVQPRRPAGRSLQRFRAISAENRRLRPDLIFVGDSITECWQREGRRVWEEFYGSRAAGNLGCSSDRVEHCLWRLLNGNLDGICPRTAVVLIGTNNLVGPADDPRRVADGIGKIVDALRAEFPQIRILVVGLFPRGEQPNEQRDLALQVNQILQTWSTEEGISYADFGSAFMDGGGGIRRELMPDFLHLSEDGYRIWATAIEAWVKSTLGTAPACQTQ